MKSKNLFAVVLKSIGFAWRTNRKLFLVLISLNIFQGSIVYLQFASFSAIVDIIIGIKQGVNTAVDLVQSSVILGLSFLFPTVSDEVSSRTGSSARSLPDRKTKYARHQHP
jgi:hypothetical protein